MNKRTCAATACAFALMAWASASRAEGSADVVVLMDESGSMSGEQAWMAVTIPTLDLALAAVGFTGNQYGLVGFGATAAGAPSYVRSFAVGGGEFGTAAQYQAASAGLVASGATEDGWAAINRANAYTFRSGAARNYILVTDEDRDNTNASLSFAALLAGLQGTNTLLNAVVAADFRCSDGSIALGLVGTRGYKANGSGGFTICEGASVVGTSAIVTQYVNLALQSGGGAWDLDILRSGGTNATSFTAAFIDGKVTEVITQVPEPSTWALLLAGLGLIGQTLRRRRGA